MNKNSGQALLESIISLAFLVPFIAGMGLLYSLQWRRSQCLTRAFREARAQLGREGQQALQSKVISPDLDSVFTRTVDCNLEKLAHSTESITLKRLESP